MIRSIKAAFASKLSIARSILRSSNFASIAIADNSDSLFESRSSRDIPIPATPARLAESPLLEPRALALARCIWWSSLFCINSWMMPCFGFLHGARAGCTGQLACARDRRAREKVEDIKTTESQEDDGESRSQGAKEPRAKEKNLSTRPAIPARTRPHLVSMASSSSRMPTPASFAVAWSSDTLFCACPEPGGSAHFYWNAYGTQCNHPAPGRTSSTRSYSGATSGVCLAPGRLRGLQ